MCAVPCELNLDEEVAGLEEEHLVAEYHVGENVTLQRDDDLTAGGTLSPMRR
jgi:hypothetical protein